MPKGPMTVMRLAVALVAIAVIATGLAYHAGAQQRVQLTVYTALENDQLEPYRQAFESDNPGITINWVRDSTGVVTARLLAERANPRADVIWGLAVTSMFIFEDNNMLEPYTPRGAEALKPAFRSPRNPMTWTGMDAFLSVICFNTAEAKKRFIRAPKSWQDLTNPIYKGLLVMPNPASSGTGFLSVAAWLQTFGEQKGWEFMDKLHQNIGVYLHSGSAPCVQAARGEYTLGISFDTRGALLKTQGFPIDVIIPKEGAGWDMEASGIHRGTRNLAGAQRLMDWSVSRKAMEMYNTWYPIVALPGLSNLPPNYPPNPDGQMIKNDFGWMAKNRDRILQEWAKRYDGKSAPR